jgi:hypothetical protein
MALDHTKVPMARKASLKKRRRAEPASLERLTLRVTLCGVEPAIWREISLPDSYSLLQLHRCIQFVFGWLDYHLFEFQVGGQPFVGPGNDAEGALAQQVALSDLDLAVGSQLLYLYDFGDGWEHEVEVRDIATLVVAEDDRLAYVLGGARAAPPEDSGGPFGYSETLAALKAATDEDDEARVEWIGKDFDPELFDRRAVNHALMLATAWGAI